MFFFGIVLFIFIIYFIIILSYTAGFIGIKEFNKKENNDFSVKMSVIIPFKNEEKNIAGIINDIKKQTLAKDNYEIIFIDDNSTDKTTEIIKENISEINNAVLIKNSGKGKKQAVITGIKKSRYDLTVSSDADCRFGKNRLKTIYDFYISEKPKLIIAPVLMTGNTFFDKLQSLDFLALTASTAGAAGIGRPIMCNGANMAYEKKVFFEFEDALNEKEISGDDVFLLHNIKKKYPDKIKYLKSEDSIVYTEAEKSLKSFINQRIRWASKSGSYKDFDTVFVALIVFLTNFFLFSGIIFALSDITPLLNVIILFSVKFIADLILLLTAGKHFKTINLLIYYPLLSIIYPFYTVIIALAGLFKKSKINVK